MTRADDINARRKRDLSAIHACKAQLKLDDETYRAQVRRVSAAHGAECSSSADMDARQRAALLVEMRAALPPHGKTPRGAYPGKPRNWKQLPDYVNKVEALLSDMGLSWAYADAIAKRQSGIPKVAWLKKEAHWIALIAALDAEQFKRWAGARIDEEIAKGAVLPTNLVKNWRRTKAALEIVLEHFGLQAELREREEAQS